MAPNPLTQERSDFRRGFVLGLAAGLLTGIPAAVALKAAGYPSDELYMWWVMVGAAYVLLLAAAAVTARRRFHLGAGLAAGATSVIALAPLLVVLDIVAHSG